MMDSDVDGLDDAKDNVPLINYTYNLKKCILIIEQIEQLVSKYCNIHNYDVNS